MRWRTVSCLAAALLLLPLSACGSDPSETSTEPAAAEVDPRVAELATITDLRLAEEKCQGVPAYPTNEVREFWQACNDRLSALILAQEIPTFELGLQYLNRKLVDGRITNVSAGAAQSALQRWLRQNAAAASNETLFRWRRLLPSEEQDSTFVFMMMRDTINEALRN